MGGAVAERTFARATLGNGLRVLVVPEAGSSLATVAIHYGVGWRDEAPDRSGFAHLFEHLMFEGSPGLPRGAYRERIHALGGEFTAFTRADFTAYWSQVPAPVLAADLAIEADRMRGITIDEQALRNQVSVVEEEIRVNVRNRPYGGFPFFNLPPVLFGFHPNAHDGYGDFETLGRSTLAEVDDFFDRYYSPANALVTLIAPGSAEDTIALVDEAFGEIPGRPRPSAVDLAEPVPTTERRVRLTDPLAPLPAVAVGYRLPPPDDLDDYLAAFVVDRLLTSGANSRLHRRLVRSEQRAHEVTGWFGNIDQPFTTRDPAHDAIVIHHSASTDDVLSSLDEEVGRLAAEGPEPAELDRLLRSEVTTYWSALDRQILRALQIGALEIVHGEAERFETLPARMREVTAERVASVAARHYAGPGRAVVEVEAGGA